MKKVDERTIEYYSKAEGISPASVSLPGDSEINSANK
jgi:hypothetical protein